MAKAPKKSAPEEPRDVGAFLDTWHAPAGPASILPVKQVNQSGRCLAADGSELDPMFTVVLADGTKLALVVQEHDRVYGLGLVEIT